MLVEERSNLINAAHLLQVDKEQAELAHANFSILRKEALAILDLVGILFVFIFL